MKALQFAGQILSAIWRHKYIWIILLFIVVAVFVDDNGFMARYRLEAENAATLEEIKAYEARYAADSARLSQLKTDPAAVVRVARENHQMKSPDEDVYFIVSPDSAATH